jgi:hypothetical protein
MEYRLAADLVVLVHCLFVLFVVLGGVLVLRYPRVAWFHVPAAIWGIGIEWLGGICPLTPLENHLRALGGQAGYHGGFIEHYLLPMLYPSGLTRTMQLALGLLVLLVNAVIYIRLVSRRKLSATE